MISHLTIAPLLIPLVTAIALLLLQPIDRRWRRGINLLGLVALLASSAQLLVGVSEGAITTYALGDWQPPFGIVLVADRLSGWMVMITALLALPVLLYTLRGDDAMGRHFHPLFQLQLFGLNGAFLTGDLFNLFVFFEVLLLASYGLLLHGGGAARTRAGLHFVVINLAGSSLFLFALGTLYGTLGTLNMADLALKVGGLAEHDLPLVRVAGLLLFAVFGLKAALLPLHLWLPEAYAHTSAAVAALFAIMTKVGVYALLRTGTLIFGIEGGVLNGLYLDWLLPLSLLTLAAGMLGAFASNRLRRTAAYLVVASVGSLLIAFALGSADAIAAGLYYLPHSVFATAALFLVVDLIGRRRRELDDLLVPGPWIKGAPLIGGMFFFTAVLVAGLPPFGGFLAKFLTLRAAMDHPSMPWIMAFVLVAAVVGILALARGGSQVFFHADENQVQGDSLRLMETLPVVLLLLMAVVVALSAGPLVAYAEATAAQLLQPQLYIDAVLSNGGEG